MSDALSVTAHRRVTGPIVLTSFGETAAQHGTPASTLTDNGMVYTTRFSGGKGCHADQWCATREVETGLRIVMRAFGLHGGEAVVTYSTVSVSYVSRADAEATTAIRDVRRWQPDYNRLAAAATLIRAIRDGRADLDAAETEIERVEASAYPYPRWLGFAAPALLSAAVTIMFGGRFGDALATLGIGLAIQPAWTASSAAN